ncbi:hypothetical protein D1007_15689 [Hordeum vulgare]|nr:hypothetical protein D1007_15689 [Hordeum vulgare]
MEIGYQFDAKTGSPKRAREMEILRQRFQAELVAVRGLLRKAAAVRLPSAPRAKETRPGLLAEEPPAKKMKASPPVPAPVPVPVKAPRKMTSKERNPPAEEPPAKKRKASPPPVPVIKSKKPKMTGSEREMLAEDLEAFVAEIPDHVVELLKKQSCATRLGEIEIDLHGLDDAAVVELQEQVDKFAREKRAANPPPQERHQDGPKVTAQEEEEEEEYVDICGGVSPLAIVPAPLLQLVQDEATSGSPSSSSGNDSDSEDECVDICGGVSPLAFVPAPLPLPLVEEETNSGSPSSSSSGDSDTDDSSRSDSDDSEHSGSSGDSDTDDSSSSDSDDSEHSGSSSDSDSDSDDDSPAPAIIRPPTCEQVACSLERQQKEATSRAREKARQEVLQTERNAMPDDTLHREDVKGLGIDEYNTAKSNNLLWQIGLYLKVDDDDDWKQQHRQSFHQDLEEGEIR